MYCPVKMKASMAAAPVTRCRFRSAGPGKFNPCAPTARPVPVCDGIADDKQGPSHALTFQIAPANARPACAEGAATRNEVGPQSQERRPPCERGLLFYDQRDSRAR